MIDMTPEQQERVGLEVKKRLDFYDELVERFHGSPREGIARLTKANAELRAQQILLRAALDCIAGDVSAEGGWKDPSVRRKEIYRISAQALANSSEGE